MIRLAVLINCNERVQAIEIETWDAWVIASVTSRRTDFNLKCYWVDSLTNLWTRYVCPCSGFMLGNSI